MPESLGYGYKEEGAKETLSKVLKTLGILIFCGALIFLLIKTFYLNKPKTLPKEVAISYLKAEQDFNREEAEKYLSADWKKLEILGEKYENLSKRKWIVQETKGKEPTFEIKDEKVEGNQTNINLVEKTNKKLNQPFFEFLLPKVIVFDVVLEKQGSWKDGYSWQIIKIDSPTLLLESKIGKEVEINNGIFVKPIKIEEYLPKDIELPEKIHILSLEIVYRNKTNKSVNILSFGEWRLVDKQEKIFYPPPLSSAIALRKPAFLGQEIRAGQSKKGYVVFEVSRETLPNNIEKIIFKDFTRKIIFDLK